MSGRNSTKESLRGQKVTHKRITAILAILAGAIVAAFWISCRSARNTTITIDRERREIRFPATVHVDAFDRSLFQPGHHSVVSRYGISRFGALFLADPSDLDVRHALEEIGAVPGENLTPESWTEREDPSSAAPDLHVEGTRIEVFVESKGARHALADLIDPSTDSILDFRYGGNEEYRSRFHSGCIVCNYSCPGGAVGNHTLTIRDEVKGRVTFKVAKTFPFSDGERVVLILRVVD